MHFGRLVPSPYNVYSYGQFRCAWFDGYFFLSSKVNSTGTTVPTINQSTTNPNAFLNDIKGFVTIVNSLEHISDYILLIEGVTGIITNSLLILVVLIDPLKRLRAAKSTVIILSLSLADLLTSGAALCLSVPIQLSDRATVTSSIFLWFGFCASLLNLFVFTYERFIVTLYPLKAKLIISYRRTAFACLTSWIVGAAIATPGHLIEEVLTRYMIEIVKIVFLEFLVVVMVVLNIRIILSIRKHASQMNGELQYNKAKSNKTLRDVNAVLSTLIILFIITTMPYLITQQVWHLLMWCKMSSFKCLPSERSTTFKLGAFPALFLPLGMINFLVNPILYAWRLDSYRASALALFSKELRQRGSLTS